MSEIKGHRQLSEDEIECINELKNIEHELLALVDSMSKESELDQRWVSIGKTHIEQGFMALVRSIAKPKY